MADYSAQWGVSVQDVLALAPHVTVVPADSTTPVPDPEYGVGTQRGIREVQVEGWVKDVASRVQAHRISLGVDVPEVQEGLDTLAADAVKNGAAAYLVDAAFPARSGVNDQASYGQVLWARYQSALDAMAAIADRVRPGGEGGLQLPQGGAVGFFPPVSVRDYLPGGPAIW